MTIDMHLDFDFKGGSGFVVADIAVKPYDNGRRSTIFDAESVTVPAPALRATAACCRRTARGITPR